MKNIKSFKQFVNESYKINEAREPKNWDSMFAMKVVKAYEDGEFDPADKKSVEEWDTKYNGGNKPRPAFNTKEIVDYAIKTGKYPDGSKLNEMASFAGRAWSGKLENLDNLFSWMYDKGILNKGEKAKKDSVFRQYYRWYNDGDFPRGLAKAKNVSQYDSDEKIEKALEEYVEDFMKMILAKYAGKYDRRKFRYDQLLSQLYTLQKNIKFEVPEGQEDDGRTENFSYDVNSFMYFYKKIGSVTEEFDKLVVDLEKLFKKFSATADKQIEAKLKTNPELGDWNGYLSTNQIFGVKKKNMEKADIWTAANQKDYDAIVAIMNRLHEIISDVIEATNKAKAALGEK